MSDFNGLTIVDLNDKFGCVGIEACYVPEDIESYELFDDDGDYRFETELECVEHWAGENHLISSESEAVERYKDMLRELDFKTLAQLEHDQPMQAEIESSYLDSLIREGQLHSEQFSSYEISADYGKLLTEALNK